MWIALLDKQREYVINFANISCFGKISSCKHEPGIEIVTVHGAINLLYDTEEERDTTYDLLIQKLQVKEI